MKPLAQRILESLRLRPNQLAQELANHLGEEKAEITRVLYGELQGQVLQRSDYRWFLASKMRKQDEPDNIPYQNTPLGRLARYYLACISQEELGISTPAMGPQDSPAYSELSSLPRNVTDLENQRGYQQLAGKLRSETGRWDMYLGYPTSLRFVQQRNGWQGFMVEPVFLFSIDRNAGNGQLELDLTYPIINQKVLQDYTNIRDEGLMEELARLEKELGIGEPGHLIELDDLALRLQSIRTEWPWQEAIEPWRLSGQETEGPAKELTDEFYDPDPMTYEFADSGSFTPPLPRLSELDRPGVYNRAVVVMTERSPFTKGLESELRELASLPSGAADGSVLGSWLAGSHSQETKEITAPLIEVLPMNSEQYAAVEAALTKPLSVITGPPGTGKSQVVTNLLVNSAWQGQRVLFASKNNKAVDVVEGRVNGLGSRPLLLRAGAQQYRGRLAEYLVALMAATSTEEDRHNFNEAIATNERLLEELKQIRASQDSFITLRNEVDNLDQAADSARSVLPKSIAGHIETLDLDDIRRSLNKLRIYLDRLDRPQQSIITRLFWSFRIKEREAVASQSVLNLQAGFERLGLDYPDTRVNEKLLPEWRQFVIEAERAVSSADQVKAYIKALKKLQRHEPLEAISKRRIQLFERIAANSIQLWSSWMNLQPSQLTSEDRQMLTKYKALMDMVLATGPEGRLTSEVFHQYQALFPEVSHLLSCWAVTSLSARGKIPFDTGYFDLVVFDEASQCDIASALPLLRRAKRVVVIGDPKQLAHISSLQKGKDQQLLSRFNLIADYPHWAYSVNSLFDLASGMVSGGDVISLRDHHRSHGDIIEFSNRQFYEGRLRVATRYESLKMLDCVTTPGVVWRNIEGKAVRPAGGGAANYPEIQSIVVQLTELVFNLGYKGSIGVVCPFRAQANAIRIAIDKDKKLAKALMANDALVDTVHRFQGDERDLMIFSPVVAKGISPSALAFLKNNGNLFNVAITRARSQLIVIGDMSACASCGVDYLESFAKYTLNLMESQEQSHSNTEDDLGPRYPTVSNPEQVSEWEKVFYEALYRAGISTLPQFHIEKYALDLALIDGDRQLNIEVDGERFHRNWTGELCRRDQIRNQRLFELGWDVMRFWVYEIRDDLDGCVQRVKDWLTDGVGK